MNVFEEIKKRIKPMVCGGMNSPQWIPFRGLIEMLDDVEKEYNNGWIPFVQRKLTTEEKEEMVTDYDFILDCKLPEEDEEILVTYANGHVDTDIFLRDGSDCYLDSGNDFITEAIAWMPKPQPYKGE